MFSLPDIAGVLDSRELVVEVVQDGDKTAIRVDAQVTWQPAVPASEKVPAAAKAVTISMDLAMNQGSKKPPKPVTITDPAKVGQLRALINSLPLFPPGVFSCPAAFGDNLVLTFRARPGGPALAVATDMLSGCGGVDLTIGGQARADAGRRERPPDPQDRRPILENTHFLGPFLVKPGPAAPASRRD